MSDETKKVEQETKEEAAAADAAFQAAVGAQSISRGKEPNLITKALSVFKILKGNNRLTRYLAPVFSVATFDADMEWFGKENAVNVLNTYGKRVFQELWLDNIDKETGLINLPKFLTDGADFTAAGMKMKEIDDKIDELQEISGRIVMEGDLSKNADGTDSADVLKLRELQTLITGYKAMKDKKSRKDKPEANAEPAVEVR